MKKNKHALPALLCVAAISLSLLLTACSDGGTSDTQGEWKPDKPVNMIVAYAAGGGTDIMARTIAKYIDLDGQSMYVTNIEGGGGSVGSMEAYHADNDGLTLFLHTIEGCAGGVVGGTYPENLCEDMEWVACMVEDPQMMAVTADSRFKTLEDVINEAQANPGKISVAGIGGMSTEASIIDIENRLNVQFTFVPYDSGAKGRAAVLGGHDDIYYNQLAEVKTYVDSGEMRVLVLSADERSDFVPDTPTFKEYGYDIVYGSNRCVMLPPNTDEKIVKYYEQKLKEVFDNEEFASTLRDTLGYNPVFTGTDGIRDKIDKILEWHEEYVPRVLAE